MSLEQIKDELLKCYENNRQPVLLYGDDHDGRRKELIREVWLACGGVDKEEEYFNEYVSVKHPKNPTTKEKLEEEFKKEWIKKYKTTGSRSSEGNSYYKELTIHIYQRTHITDKTWRRINCGSWNGEQAHNELIRNISDIHHHDRYNANTVRSKGLVMPNGYLFLCRGLVFLDNLHCNSGDAEDSNHYRKIAKVIHDRKWGSHTYDDTGIPLQGGCTEQTKFDWLVVYTPDHKTFPPYFEEQFKVIPLSSKVEEKKIEGFHDVIQTNDYEFFLSGNMWTISYEGKTKHFQDSIGLKYIHYLLEESGNEFYSLELMREINKIPVPKDENIFGNTEEEQMDEEQQKGQFMEEGLSVGNAEGSTEEILDEKAIKEYRERYAELKSELEDGELSPTEIAENEEEIAQIMKVLGAGLDKRGQSRKVSNPTERARRSVSKAINKSLDKIKDKENGIPALWKHFVNTLTIGISCSYKSEKPIPWAL